jgi:malonyl-CoA/methylmalonyl-CoA synthetase
MGRFDSEGYLAIIGRDKDLIISGGLNVYPKEIEEAIDALPGVAESAVIGLPHPDFGEAVTAVVVRGRDASGLTAEGIIAALRGNIAGFKVPKAVHFVDDLPRNAMGKVQKNRLRERFGDAGKSQPP